MSDQQPPPLTAERARLEYAQPVGRARTTLFIYGIVASVFFAFGSGMLAFGMTMREGDREAPVFVGIGVSTLVLTTGCLVSAHLARR